MLTYPDLNDARIERLSAAADLWQRMSTLCETLGKDSATTLTAPLRASGWAGDAATAAFGRLDLIDDEFEVAALRSRTAAIVLRSAVADFTELQKRLRAAAEAAAAVGLSVDAQGRITPPDLGSESQNDPDREAIYRRDVENAAIYTDVLTSILAEATDTDNRVARALTDLRSLSYGQDAWEYNLAGKGAQTAAAAMGLSPDAVPAAGTDPAAVKAWWDSLSADERQIHLTAWPDRVGVLDGLPALDRDQANQLALRNFIGENVNTGRDHGIQHDRAVTLLNRFENQDSSATPMYLLTFDPLGDGKAAVAVGNPDTAANTAVFVPGVGTELEEFGKHITNAQALQDKATVLAGGKPASVIAWLGYDTPGGGGTGTDLVTAPFGGKSEAGAEALTSFVDGLRTSHDDSPSHITGVGHSYGSTVFGEAADTSEGKRIAVDDIVVVGSPGMRVDQASDLSTGTDHTWATAALDDNFVARPEHTTTQIAPGLIAVLGPAGIPAAAALEPLAAAVHGPAPHDPEFGGQILAADTSGHSGYWTPDSRILTAQAAIIAGNYDAARDYGKPEGR